MTKSINGSSINGNSKTGVFSYDDCINGSAGNSRSLLIPALKAVLPDA